MYDPFSELVVFCASIALLIAYAAPFWVPFTIICYLAERNYEIPMKIVDWFNWHFDRKDCVPCRIKNRERARRYHQMNK